jgi:hypothetical protein
MNTRSGVSLTQWCAFLVLVLGSGCATPLTPQGARVFVVRAPLASPPQQPMPSGCTLATATSTLSRTEFELEGQHDPFREDRNKAGAAGANVLVVRSRMVVPRRDFSCPASSPITDCPSTSGAWYDVVIEMYTCPDDVAEALGARKSLQ